VVLSLFDVMYLDRYR